MAIRKNWKYADYASSDTFIKKKKKYYARSSKLCQKLRKYNLFVLYNKELKYTGKKV